MAASWTSGQRLGTLGNTTVRAVHSQRRSHPMSGTSRTSQTHHTTKTTHATSAISRELKHAAAEEHKAVRSAHKVDSAIREIEVLSSGNPRRIRRYFMRKFAYKLFGKLMGKTINRL
jgi:hypothetical protein